MQVKWIKNMLWRKVDLKNLFSLPVQKKATKLGNFVF